MKTFRVYAINPHNSSEREFYGQTLYPDEEALSEPCSERNRTSFEKSASKIVKEIRYFLRCGKTRFTEFIFDIDLRKIGGSALTSDIDVPIRVSSQQSAVSSQNIKTKDSRLSTIPITYVPARNTIFLSLALAWAEVLEAEDIFIGANAIDYSGYPDCRPEYIDAFEKMANLATKAGVEGKSRIKIHTPLINLTKGEIIKKGISLGVDYSLTSSCYSPDKGGNPCGLCDSCQFRLKGFKDAGIKDPLTYKQS